MSVKGKVLIAAPVHPVLTEGLETEGYQLVSFPEIRQEQAFELIRSCVGVVTSTRLQLDAALIDAAPDLRWIGRMGSGMEVIDQVHAERKGIVCVASPEGNCNAVAEHALGLLLSLTRNIHISANEVVEGKWLREQNRGFELEGRTIGLIGFGHTGRAFARKLRGMDMRILAFDIAPQTEVPEFVEMCSLERIQQEAEIISFHVPFGPDTYHYFNASFAEAMRHNFWLLNTSRGTVVDAAILPQLLDSGKLRGAGLDVWEKEPISRLNNAEKQQLDEIIGRAHLILTAHIAGYTYEALYKMSATLLQKIQCLSGL